MATLTIPISTPLNRGQCYTLSFTSLGTGTITFRLGSTEGGSTSILVYGGAAADVTQDFDFPLVGGEDFENIYLVEGVGGDNFQIENMEITLQEVCSNVYCSQCYSVDDCPDGVLLQWTNDDNGLGFNYANLGFIQQVRVKGGLRIQTGNYNDETFHTTSDGEKGILYTHAVGQEELWIHHQPQYIHAAIFMALAHDHFFIDGVEFVKSEGGYNPDWLVPESLLAPVTVAVELKEQNTFNQNC